MAGARMTPRDRIEAGHYDATHGERHEDDRPSWREAEEEMRPRRGDPVMSAEEYSAMDREGIERGWWS